MSPDTQRIGYAPITRIDPQRREIEVTATSEALDSYGTIFAYEASRAAFARWLGNVREMHDAVAVGKRVAVRDDPDHRAIRVRLRISTGAESTWQKILDGTLCGASIGAANVTWRDIPRAQLPATLRGNAAIPDPARVATAYDLVELSLVDAPANPDCRGVTLVRAAQPDPDLLDPLDDDPPQGDPVDTVIDMDAAPPPNPLPIAPLRYAMERGNLTTPCPQCGRLDSDESASPRASRREEEQPSSPLHAPAGGGAGGGAVLAAVERLARDQRAQLADLAARLARIEAQPLPGGPMLRAAEKTLGAPGLTSAANLAERIAALQTFAARATDQRAQVEVAAEILRLQRGE